MRNKIIVTRKIYCDFNDAYRHYGASRVTMPRRLNGSTRLLPQQKAAAYFNNASWIENALKCSPVTITDWPKKGQTHAECERERVGEGVSASEMQLEISRAQHKKQRYKANFWLLRLSSRLHTDKRAARRQYKDTHRTRLEAGAKAGQGRAGHRRAEARETAQMLPLPCCTFVVHSCKSKAKSRHKP